MQNLPENKIEETKISFEKEKSSKETIEKLYQETKEGLEKKELLIKKEKAIKEKLEEEITKMRLSPQLANDAKKKAVQIKSLDKRGKLEHLLGIAEENGIAFAVTVAKKIQDPYILDAFHDILAKEGLYKKFKK